MDDNGGRKLTGIRQIVRLKEILHKWQAVTLGSKTLNNDNNNNNPRSTCSTDHDRYQASKDNVFPVINKRLTNVTYADSDEESCQSPEPPHDVPKGYLAVYVGPELRRFIIPTTYLTHSLFKMLLEKAEEEFGFDHSGAITIPCEIETFKYLLKCMETHHKPHPHHHTSEILGEFAAGNSSAIQE